MLEKILSKYINDIKYLYYEYFYTVEVHSSFKSHCFYSNVIKKLNEHQKLSSFLEKIESTIKPDKELNSMYIINSLMFKSMVKLEYKYFDSLNIFILLLQEFEKKEFLFNGFEKDRINKNINQLINLYKKKGYCLNNETEFNKYKLIEITNTREMKSSQENRIIDKKYEITFDIHYIENTVYKKINELYQEKKFKISFYPNCLTLKNYIDKSLITFDAIEFGAQYSSRELKTIKIKSNLKFVDYEYKNKLYIKTSNEELTFEEIQDNPKEFQEDILFTKLIHLIFEINDDTLYIKHIDLEYIFYSLEEYIERFEDNNFQQKGKIIKRQKIFKIDEAKIDLEKNLYDLIYYSLDNKELVNEYFSMLDKNIY